MRETKESIYFIRLFNNTKISFPRLAVQSASLFWKQKQNKENSLTLAISEFASADALPLRASSPPEKGRGKKEEKNENRRIKFAF